MSYAIQVTKVEDRFVVTQLVPDADLPSGTFAAQDLPEQIKKCLALIMWQDLGVPRKNCGVQVERNVFHITRDALLPAAIGSEKLWQDTNRGGLTP